MVDPCRREAWRAEARAWRAESRGGVPDRRPGVVEHSRHSDWFLWHLSVRCLDSTQQSGVSQQKGAGSIIRGSGSQIRGAGSEIRRDPPNLTPEFILKLTGTTRIVHAEQGLWNGTVSVRIGIQTRRCRFAAVSPAGMKYWSIAAAAACGGRTRAVPRCQRT